MFYLVAEDGKFTATAKVCEVESHISVGFRMDEHIQDQRYAFVMVYFSHGGSWKGIEKSEFFLPFIHNKLITI